MKKKYLNYIPYLQQFVVQLIAFGVSIYLTRLLSIAEYGYIAILGLIFTFPNLLINVSIEKSMLTKAVVKSVDYSTHLIFNILLALTMYLAIVSLSSFAENHFNVHRLSDYLIVMGSSLIFDSISLVYSVKLIRENHFALRAKIFIVSSIVSSITGLVSLYNGCGLWSYVFMVLVNSFIQCFLHLIFVKLDIKLIFKIKILSEHIKSSLVALLIYLNDGLINFVYTYVLTVINPSSLGLFSRGDSLSKILSLNVSNVIDKYYFSFYSKYNKNTEMLYAHTKVSVNLFLLMISFSTFMFFSAKSIYEIAFGSKWIIGVDSVQYLIFAAFFIPNDRLFKSMVFSKLPLRLNFTVDILKVVLMLVPCIVLYFWGYHFFLAAIVAARLLVMLINNLLMRKYLNSRSLLDFYMVLLLIANITIIKLLDYFTLGLFENMNEIIITINHVVIVVCFYFLNRYFVNFCTSRNLATKN
jgi:O-antigen/teichoic acid export membrane protein